LEKDSVPVAIIESAPVLLPVNAGEHAVQVLEIVMVVLDPRFRLGHAKLGIAARHALNAHQANALAVEVKSAIRDLDRAHAEAG